MILSNSAKDSTIDKLHQLSKDILTKSFLNYGYEPTDKNRDIYNNTRENYEFCLNILYSIENDEEVEPQHLSRINDLYKHWRNL